jgi:hypothetical protein
LERIFVATVFKSGTKLIEHIIEELTGLSAVPVGMEAGSDYENAGHITFEDGKFFIWHNVPTFDVQSKIRNEYAKTVFLIRNIYDLAVSQYFHFAQDVDKEIGHSTKTIEYFEKMSQEEGMSLILCGATSEHFHWHGFGYYLRQIQEMLKFSKEYPCHVISYDRLVQKKPFEIEALAAFLGVTVAPETIDSILESSTLRAMRNKRIASVGSGNHFRKGSPGDHVNVLSPHHYDMISYLKLTYAPDLDKLCNELEFCDITSASPPAEAENQKS